MNGILRIAAERKRQIEVEGWTSEHDDTHTRGELSYAAVSYALEAGSAVMMGQGDCPVAGWAPQEWPFNGIEPGQSPWWKPSDDPIRNLEKAGALIAAEIDRLDRARSAQCQAMTASICTRCADKVDPDFEFCPSCCDDHDFEYDSQIEWASCLHCGKIAPPDFYDESDDIDRP